MGALHFCIFLMHSEPQYFRESNNSLFYMQAVEQLFQTEVSLRPPRWTAGSGPCWERSETYKYKTELILTTKLECITEEKLE